MFKIGISRNQSLKRYNNPVYCAKITWEYCLKILMQDSVKTPFNPIDLL